MPHRIFLAIPTPFALQEQISQFQSRFSSIPVRWVTGSNLHITLVPPWEETNPDTVIRQMQTALSKRPFKPFPVSFSKITFGPSSKNPRLIWAKGNDSTDATQLKEWLERLTGHFSEYPRFNIHLTLARFRPEDFPSFQIQTLNEPVDWSMNVDSFVLMESHLRQSGAEYRELSRFPLNRGYEREIIINH